jgi:arginase family enzyme
VALTAVHARISETTPRDLRGVEALAAGLARHGLGPVSQLDGRIGPYRRTSWREDLPAAAPTLRAAAESAVGAIVEGEVPVTLATDCSLALGTLPAVAGSVDGLMVLWLDAHADYDTPDTTTIDFLGCMSLAGACGAWDSGLGALDPDRVVHLGARAGPGDFDFRGQVEAADALHLLAGCEQTDAALAGLSDGPVYVHLDPDVLDPEVFPVPYGRPGGLGADGLLELVAAVAARGPVAGVEITAFHAPPDAATRDRMTELLAHAVARLVR